MNIHNHSKPFPITPSEIYIHDMEHLGQGLYTWENDSLEVRVRVNRRSFSIESVEEKLKTVTH